MGKRKTTQVLQVIWMDGPAVHSAYFMNSFAGKRITPTGWLKVFEFLPNKAGDPEFHARWDEKSNRLDIDIHKVSKSVKRRFTNEVAGYKGHHPPWQSKSPRCFRVTVSVPNMLVCEGSVSFGLLSEEHLTAHAVATAELELTHIPGPR